MLILKQFDFRPSQSTLCHHPTERSTTSELHIEPAIGATFALIYLAVYHLANLRVPLDTEVT